jgi:hypothetical protein
MATAATLTATVYTKPFIVFFEPIFVGNILSFLVQERGLLLSALLVSQ